MDDAAAAFLRFIGPHWKPMHVVARRYASCGDAARDLVQETLLRAWRSFSPADGRDYGRAWLYVIMRSAAADWSRSAGRRIGMVPASHAELTELAGADLTEPFQPWPAMDEARFREFLDDHVVAALESLEPRFREVIILSVAGGLTYREIGAVLDCPIGTVMSRMARARRALRAQLAGFARQRGWVREPMP